jgi:hypothetical protein
MTPLRIPVAPYAVSVVLMNLSFLVTLGLWLALARAAGRWASPEPALRRDDHS